jgi:hypothetical protein
VLIGSEEHKQLFCRSFMESHCAYDPKEWTWPQLDELSLARLRAVPIWTLALEVELGAGAMLEGFARTEPDPLVRQALELQGYEEDRHGRILQCLVERYGLTVSPDVPKQEPTRRAFIDFGYNECVDSFAGFGIFRLARDARIFPEGLTSLFARVLVEEARHIVFFVNWVAWDRCRRGIRGLLVQALPVTLSYGGAIWRRIKGGAQMQRQNESVPSHLFDDALKNLTPGAVLRASIDENERHMASFDPRLLRPRVIPTLAKLALAIVEVVERVRLFFGPSRSRKAFD